MILPSSLTMSPVVVAPSVPSSLGSSTRSTRSSVSTVTETSLISPVQLNYKADDDSSISHCGSIPLASTNRGTKRLSNMAIIHVHNDDNITVVVPSINASEPATAQSMGSWTPTEICKVFFEGESKSIVWRKGRYLLPPSLLNMSLREGGEISSIQCRIKIDHYAEGYNLSEHLTMTVINQYMEVHGRGLSVSLNG